MINTRFFCQIKIPSKPPIRIRIGSEIIKKDKKCVILFNYVKSMMQAITRAKRPIASDRAKPRIA